MGDTKDRVGAAGVIVAGGFFKIALYVCVAVLVIWIDEIRAFRPLIAVWVVSHYQFPFSSCTAITVLMCSSV